MIMLVERVMYGGALFVMHSSILSVLTSGLLDRTMKVINLVTVYILVIKFLFTII